MIEPGTKILIAGDSWGCGEWTPESIYVRPHLGLEQYFREYGCNVLNLSIGGIDNNASAGALALLGQRFDPHVTLWIQTDPLRNFDERICVFPDTIDELLAAQRKLLTGVYQLLNTTAVRPVYCLGGCSKLDTELMANYVNLIPVVPSIIEFFGCVAPAVWCSHWTTTFNFTTAALDMVLANTKDPLKILDKQWFWPDGGHPNRAAHHKLFEYLVQHVDSPKF